MFCCRSRGKVHIKGIHLVWHTRCQDMTKCASFHNIHPHFKGCVINVARTFLCSFDFGIPTLKLNKTNKVDFQLVSGMKQYSILSFDWRTSHFEDGLRIPSWSEASRYWFNSCTNILDLCEHTFEEQYAEVNVRVQCGS